MQKLYITTNACSSTILITKDGKIITALPLDADSYIKVEDAYKKQQRVNDWPPNWEDDGRSIEEYGEVVMKIPAEGKIEGDLNQVKALSEMG